MSTVLSDVCIWQTCLLRRKQTNQYYYNHQSKHQHHVIKPINLFMLRDACQKHMVCATSASFDVTALQSQYLKISWYICSQLLRSMQNKLLWRFVYIRRAFKTVGSLPRSGRLSLRSDLLMLRDIKKNKKKQQTLHHGQHISVST